MRVAFFNNNILPSDTFGWESGAVSFRSGYLIFKKFSPKSLGNFFNNRNACIQSLQLT